MSTVVMEPSVPVNPYCADSSKWNLLAEDDEIPVQVAR